MKIEIISKKVICENAYSDHRYAAWPSVARLKNGRLAMVTSAFRLGHIDPFGKGVICFSEDEGQTWSKGFVLDERFEISYPDSDQDEDGNIYITYDRNRIKDGEIYMARLREEDILAGSVITHGSFIKRVVRKPGKLSRPEEA